MNEISPKIIKKLQTLAQIAAELRQGRDFKITRLTVLKSLCSEQEAAAEFALHLAKLTVKKMNERACPSHIGPEDWQQYQRLAQRAVRGMRKHLSEKTPAAESPLYPLLQAIRNCQNESLRQEGGTVRRIHSKELLAIETALECVVRPHASQLLAYDLARHYCERYDARYGTGLIPESAPMVEDIAEFWGRRFLGRGWRKRLAP